MKRFLYFIPIVMFFSCSLNQSGPESGKNIYEKNYARGLLTLTETIDKLEITTADTVKITLEGSLPKEWKLIFPVDQLDYGSFSEVSENESFPRLLEDSTVVYKKEIILKPFLPGEYQVPSFSVAYSGNDQEEIMETDPVTVSVSSVITEDNKDIYDIIEPERRLTLWIIYGIIIAASAAAVVMLIIRLFPREKKEETGPVLSAYKKAEKELSLLLKEHLPENGLIKDFYIRISGIVRIYIEEQFGIRAPEQTTEEFLQSLTRSKEHLRDYTDLLMDFLRHCDLVKFAAYLPMSDEIQGTVDSCYRFIRTTGQEAERHLKDLNGGA